MAITLSRRSIERYLAAYDCHGAAAFAPRARADRGHAKCLISLAAEQAIPFDDETWEAIAGALRDYIRGHWKAGATLKLIENRAHIRFRELIEAAGFERCDMVPASVLKVPRRFVNAERHYRHVHTLYRDRKQYEDTRFRTQRARVGMQPGDWVCCDVHPVDIEATRPDGSRAYARMLAWLDCATNRMCFDLVLCEPGTGIRNADLIVSFCRMLADPTWGMPKTLYIDNGREYRFADNLNDALQLVAQLRGSDGRTTRAVHAQPYNAAAKPIESMFSALEKMLQDIPGHTGGDRLNKKTERVGRPVLPFTGTVEQLAQVIRGRIAEMEMYPMRGALGGKSPRQAYEAAVRDGWRPVAVNPAEILTVFGTDKVCRITKGVIALDNLRWSCPELATYFERRIVARIPRFWKATKLPLLHIKTRELIGIAEPIEAVAFDDVAGARLTQDANKARQRAIRTLDRSAPSIDTVQEGLRISAALPAPTIAPPVATIGINDEAAAIAAQLRETPGMRADRRQARLERERRQRLALYDKFEKGGG
jgi:hypothetical protein